MNSSFIKKISKHKIYDDIITKALSENKFVCSPNKRLSSKRILVSILVSESAASILDLQSQHIQDIKENVQKSKICIFLNNSPTESTSLHTPINNNEAIRPATSINISDAGNITGIGYSRIIPMKTSSSSFFGLDDLSEVKFNKEPDKISLYLQPDIVCTQSVMIVQSCAHENKLNVEANTIFVSVLDNELPVTSSGWINVCRICHGGESCEELIGPCRCRGSIALAHITCLERWLKESANSHCELCHHHYEIRREPKYSIPRSIIVWILNPGEHGPELLEDIVAFFLYTPAAVCSTYILMLLCDCATKSSSQFRNNTSHLITFFSIAGMAAIDFTYSSWLMMRLNRHVCAWRSWFRENCCLTLILPPRKRRRLQRQIEPIRISESTT